jgi:hypothetical protein
MKPKKCNFANMNKYELHERIIEQKDWAFVLFLLALGMIGVVRNNFENRFSDFMRLFFSDKYAKIYKDGSLIMSWFTVILFVVQLIIFSFFIQLSFNFYGFVSKTNWVVFVQIFTFLTIFVLSKFTIEKIIATAFDIEDFVEQYNMFKVSYRSYLSLLLIPFCVLCFYNFNIPDGVFYGVFLTIFLMNLLIYAKLLKINQTLLIGNLIYFILYLCTLEIAPYYFMYYWFTKS